MVDSISPSTPVDWLEPSYGEGVFLQSLSAAGISPENITALELSRKRIREIESLAQCLRGVDALGWLARNRRSFGAIIGNPPYVAGSDLSEVTRTLLSSVVDPASGEALSGSTNIWVAFLVLSLRRLAKGGNLAFVLPASWDFASYASSLRNWLPSQFESFTVLRSDKPLFAEVTEGCVVIVGHGYNMQHQLSSRIECRDIDSAVAALRRLAVSWPLLPNESGKAAGSTVRLGDLIKLRLGGVTGDKRYFVISESMRLAHSLPEFVLLPVVTKSRHLGEPIITKGVWKHLRDSDEPVWLFRPSEKDLNDDNVRRYLELPASQGGCDRSALKIRLRDPWYQTVMPPPAHGFVSGVTSGGMRLSISEMPGLSATNTLNTVTFSDGLAKAHRYGIAKYLIGRDFARLVKEKERRYAGGLRKMEPGDLMQMRIPSPLPVASRSEYIAAFRVEND